MNWLLTYLARLDVVGCHGCHLLCLYEALFYPRITSPCLSPNNWFQRITPSLHFQKNTFCQGKSILSSLLFATGSKSAALEHISYLWFHTAYLCLLYLELQREPWKFIIAWLCPPSLRLRIGVQILQVWKLFYGKYSKIMFYLPLFKMKATIVTNFLSVHISLSAVVCTKSRLQFRIPCPQ